jgi:hypothetical protein
LADQVNLTGAQAPAQTVQPNRQADHYIAPAQADFSTSWWMSEHEAEPAPSHVQAFNGAATQSVLTEFVFDDVDKNSGNLAASVSAIQEPAVDLPRAEPSPAQLAHALLVKRVLANVDHQVGALFEQRLREVVVPSFARATDSLLKELRHEIALSLRDMVARAVQLEIERSTGTGNSKNT